MRSLELAFQTTFEGATRIRHDGGTEGSDNAVRRQRWVADSVIVADNSVVLACLTPSKKRSSQRVSQELTGQLRKVKGVNVTQRSR